MNFSINLYFSMKYELFNKINYSMTKRSLPIQDLCTVTVTDWCYHI